MRNPSTWGPQGTLSRAIRNISFLHVAHIFSRHPRFGDGEVDIKRVSNMVITSLYSLSHHGRYSYSLTYHGRSFISLTVFQHFRHRIDLYLTQTSFHFSGHSASSSRYVVNQVFLHYYSTRICSRTFSENLSLQYRVVLLAPFTQHLDSYHTSVPTQSHLPTTKQLF